MEAARSTRCPNRAADREIGSEGLNPSADQGVDPARSFLPRTFYGEFGAFFIYCEYFFSFHWFLIFPRWITLKNVLVFLDKKIFFLIISTMKIDFFTNCPQGSS